MVHQDIQELNRLLFEQLENNLKDTSEKSLISDLYRGVLRTWTSKFTELPPILTLSLSRFYYDAKTMESCKLDKMCSFPILLDMTNYVAGKMTLPVTYDLFSIVIHVGAAACGGHYHAFIKDPYGYIGGSVPPDFMPKEPTSDPKPQSSHVTDPIQTNTNHPFMCYRDSSETTTAQRVRAQSQQRYFQPCPRRSESDQDPTRAPLVNNVTSVSAVKFGRIPRVSLLGKALRAPGAGSHNFPHSKDANSTTSGVSSSSEEAKSLTQSKVAIGSKNLPVDLRGRSNLRENLTARNLRTELLATKPKWRTYSQFVNSMRRGLASCQQSQTRSASTYRSNCNTTSNSQLVFSSRTSNRSREPSSLAGGTHVYRRKPSTPTSVTHSDSTIDIDVSDKSDWTSGPHKAREAFTTSRNNDDSKVSKRQSSVGPSNTQSQRTPRSSSGFAEAWQSRLFGQYHKPHILSSSGLHESRSSSKTPTRASLKSSPSVCLEGDNDASTVPLASTKDSVILNRHQKRVDRIEAPSTYTSEGSLTTHVGNRISPKGTQETDSVQVPCSALRITRGGETPVIYGKWFDFNDDVVTEVSCESFKRVFQGLECAYMLFYKRTGQSIS
ncbi:unnamed protein product [Mesocestoides corti]|uniref:USP domain-containing protein n=2 Tax=Mesocestoides corti TaxID=53468 RepID=A0A3P6HR87_MESCO|nr:unnamed protein product [Mesocestoides corti]